MTPSPGPPQRNPRDWCGLALLHCLPSHRGHATQHVVDPEATLAQAGARRATPRSLPPVALHLRHTPQDAIISILGAASSFLSVLAALINIIDYIDGIDELSALGKHRTGSNLPLLLILTRVCLSFFPYLAAAASLLLLTLPTLHRPPPIRRSTKLHRRCALHGLHIL